MTSPSTELIVLVDDDGRAIGTMPKPLVHHGETPLHRAFSAYLFDDDGRLLVTRRAEGKADLPGHVDQHRVRPPRPGRGRRRRDRPPGRRSSWACEVTDLRPALPGYRYRAEFLGVVENEICPVYLGRFTGSPAPDPTEVGEWELLDWAAFRQRQETEGDAWSPWCREQARLIEEAGLVPAV